MDGERVLGVDRVFTTSGTDGAMVLDLTAGSLTLDANLASASGWNNATIAVQNAAHVYFNSPQTLAALSLLDPLCQVWG